ncbi:hypothetical protein WT98_08955 [Burkholderia territorii]|nr:hypothetical protein WT98_08955 [Burkholderia territorii]
MRVATESNLNNMNFKQGAMNLFAQPTIEQLSVKIGLASDVVRGIVNAGTSLSLASLMARAVSPHGIESARAAILSAQSNARIAEHLGDLLIGTAGLKDLETSGDALSELVTDRRVFILSDQIAMQTGVPPQASHVLTAIAAAVLFGTIKHALLLDQVSIAEFASQLRLRVPDVVPFVTDGVARDIGFEQAADFVASIEWRLAEVAKAFGAPTAYAPVPPTQTIVRANTVSNLSFGLATVHMASTSTATSPNFGLHNGRNDASSMITEGPSAPGLAKDSATAADDANLAVPIVASDSDLLIASPTRASNVESEAVLPDAPVRRRVRLRVGLLMVLLIMCGVAVLVYDQTHAGVLSAHLSQWRTSVYEAVATSGRFGFRNMVSLRH